MLPKKIRLQDWNEGLQLMIDILGLAELEPAAVEQLLTEAQARCLSQEEVVAKFRYDF